MLSFLPVALLFLLGLPSEGETLVFGTPTDDATTAPLVIGERALRVPGATAAEILGRQAGLSITRSGDEASMTLLRVRGTNPNHVRLFLDGVSLESADGRPGDLSELPLWSARRVLVWRTNAPIDRGGNIGGALEMETLVPLSGFFRLALQQGSFGSTRVSALGGWVHGETGASLFAGLEFWDYAGDFEWLDDRGTLFDASDDVVERRRNNAAREIKGMVRGDLALGSACHLLALDHLLIRHRGLPGAASSLSTRAKHERLTNLSALALRCGRGKAWSFDGNASFRLSQSEGDDPLGELSLVPTHTRHTALRPQLSLTSAHRLASSLVLRSHAEFVMEDLSVQDELKGTNQAFERLRGNLALELAGRVPHVDVELSVRGHGDAFHDLAQTQGAFAGWHAGAAYLGLQDAGFRLQAGVGRALRLPSLYELYGDGALVLASPELRPEHGLRASSTLSWQPGLGAGRSWLRLEASVFGHWLEDLIQFKRNTLRQAIAENEESAQILGVELAFSADFLSHLRVSATHTTLATESRSTILSRRGKPLPFRPSAENHAHVEAYGLASDGSELRVFLDYDHVGENTVDPAALVRIPPRHVFALGFGCRLDTGGLLGNSGTLNLGAVYRDLFHSAPTDLLGYPLPGGAFSARLQWQEDFF